MSRADRWWGWGEDGRDPGVAASAVAYLGQRLALDGTVVPHVPLDAVTLPPSRLAPSVEEALGRLLGGARVRTDRAARVRHAAGRSYSDLVRLRSGQLEAAPDAVLRPATTDRVAPVLEACADAGVAVVPFGGGTSVVGGVTPGRHASGCVSLDLGDLVQVLEVDATSRQVRAEAGITLPAFDAALASHGLTLGHLPQSYEMATLGGCVATRSAGQASTGHGRIDELVHGLRLVAPAGALDLRAHPASAAGPRLLDVVVGSEGALGVITEATVAVRPVAEVERYEAWAFETLPAGLAALRAMAQAGDAPDVVRLSDAAETEASLGIAGSAATRLLQGWLRIRGQADPCLLVVGWGGGLSRVLRRRDDARRVLRHHGAISLGPLPGRAWAHGRFSAPYLRDHLMARGALVETLETAASWAQLESVHATVPAALRRQLGPEALVGCHLSHLYTTGASLYVTVLARAERGREVEQWAAAKRAATEALLAAGATLTHHHAVGRDHAPWLSRETGDLGVAMVRALKQELDPAGIMNPGVLVARA